MEILSQRTFDIFRYIFPGLFVVGIFIIIEESRIETPDDMINRLVEKIQSNQAVFLVLFSYVVGIAHDQFCINLIRFFKLKDHFIPEYKSSSLLSSAQKYALVRHFSLKNLNEIDKWNMLKGMCVNISGFLIYFSFASLIKIISGNPFLHWLIAGILSLSCSYLIFLRSKIYSTWSIQDLDSTIDTLNLIEKGKILKFDELK